MTGSTSNSLMEDTRFPRLMRIGLSGLLVAFGDRLDDRVNRAALAFRARIEGENWPEVEETAASLASVYLRFDPVTTDADAFAGRIKTSLAEKDWFAAELPKGRRLWKIPTVFGGEDGPQFDEAARLAGRTASAAIDELTAQPVRVLTIGFAPGLPYMGTLPDNWNIPRQAGLTPLVPASAVVAAIRQLIIFPTSTPTGWRHVGQTAFRGFRPETDEPFLLRAGDEVQLVPVEREELRRISEADPERGGATMSQLA